MGLGAGRREGVGASEPGGGSGGSVDSSSSRNLRDNKATRRRTRPAVRGRGEKPGTGRRKTEAGEVSRDVKSSREISLDSRDSWRPLGRLPFFALWTQSGRGLVERKWRSWAAPGRRVSVRFTSSGRGGRVSEFVVLGVGVVGPF